MKRFKLLLKNLYETFFNHLRFFFISSLGCHSSQIFTHYRDLILSNEKAVLSYPNTHILRLPSIWGIKINPLRPKGLIGNLILSIKNSYEVKIYGDMNTLRNYISANQIGESLFILFTCEDNLKKIYNFHSNFNYSVSELMQIIKKVTKKKVFYRVVKGNLAEKESYNRFPSEGKNIIVLESLNAEISKVWRNL